MAPLLKKAVSGILALVVTAGSVPPAAAAAVQTLHSQAAGARFTGAPVLPIATILPWSAAVQGFSTWGRTPEGSLLLQQPQWKALNHPESLALIAARLAHDPAAQTILSSLIAADHDWSRLSPDERTQALELLERALPAASAVLDDVERVIVTADAFDGKSSRSKLPFSMPTRARLTAALTPPALRAWNGWEHAREVAPEPKAPQLRSRTTFSASPESTPKSSFWTTIKSLWTQANWAGKLAMAANIPFLLLSVPQIVQSVGDLTSGRGALLQGISAPATALATVGGLLMMTMGAKLKDISLTSMQVIGVVMNMTMLGLVVAAGFMPLPYFVALGAFAAAWSTIAFLSWKRAFPSWWNPLVGWLGWAAVAMFMYFPIAQLGNNAAHPKAAAGLSLLSFAIALVGSLMTLPHAFKTGNRMWFVGALWSAALGSATVIADVLMSGAISAWIFGQGLALTVGFWVACLAGVFGIHAALTKLTAAAAPDAETALYRRLAKDAPTTTQTLSMDQIHGLWRRVFHSATAGLDDPAKMKRFDPTGALGFCFGRAMAVHLMARGLGLAETSVAKLFIVGDLRSTKDPEWRFHVATLVRGPQGRWFAVDPILDGPLPVEEWIERVQGIWDKGGKAKLYLAPAAAVIPDMSRVPEIPKETGERLIELSFDPSKQSDLPRENAFGPRVYTVGAEAASRYFSLADGRPPFGFSGTVINGDPISFNNYFTSLLRELAAPEAPIVPVEPRRSFALVAEAAPARPLGLNLTRLKESNGR